MELSSASSEKFPCEGPASAIFAVIPVVVRVFLLSVSFDGSVNLLLSVPFRPNLLLFK